MPRPATAILALLFVAGCVQGTAPSSSRAGSSAGMANQVTPGMSEDDVFAVFGPDDGFARNPDNWAESCISYAYGSETAPRYVHAVFENGALLRATDGHDAPCTYAASGA